MKSQKRIRFEKIASNRVQRILDTMTSLSNCSNKNNYEYSKEDTDIMFRSLKDKLRETELILKISPKLLKNIADLYNDTNRIFMEYIDNALDSAEKYYNAKENKYEKNILITLKIIGSSSKDGTVSIEDNCTGISNISKVVQKIGDSDKSGQFTTNGQFGFGMYSFMAACGELAIYSK